MALDYYLEIKQYGTPDKQTQLRNLILNEFSLTNHEETGIMIGTGLGVSVFVDYDEFDDSGDSKMIPNLLVSFRVDKGEQREQGYELLRHIIRKIFNTIDADLRLVEENDEHVLLQRDSGRVLKFFPKHDLWQLDSHKLII